VNHVYFKFPKNINIDGFIWFSFIWFTWAYCINYYHADIRGLLTRWLTAPTLLISS